MLCRGVRGPRDGGPFWLNFRRGSPPLLLTDRRHHRREQAHALCDAFDRMGLALDAARAAAAAWA
jgi:hypothetical protein